MTTSSVSAQASTPAWKGSPGRANPHELRASCIRFGRLLREHNLPVTPERVVRWLRALEILGCEHPADLYWSGRVTLVSGYAQIHRYDDLFCQYWLVPEHPALDRDAAGATSRSSRTSERNPFALSLPGGETDQGDEERGEGAGSRPTTDGREQDRRWRLGDPYIPPGSSARSEADGADPTPAPGLYSDMEILREKDFAAYRKEDEERLRQAVTDRPIWLLPEMRSRRTRPDTRGSRIDLRRTLAEAIRRAGEPVRLLRRSPTRRWRKWVFLCDISASMAPYSKGLLLVLQAVAARRRATEVFLFGTRLTRVTPQLRRLEKSGLEVMLHSVTDYHGGTRLGESLERFANQYGKRGMAHGAVLFVLSDGLDQGEPGQVARVMRRLERMACRIVWVNPLKRTRGYEPTAQGMSEALPHVDEFLSGHNLADLLALLNRQARADR